VEADHDVAPSGLDAMLDSGEEPARDVRRTFGSGVLVAVAAGMVAVVVLVGVALVRGVAVSGRPQGARTWIDQTLGPTAPEPPPAGAIPGISVSGVVRLDDAGSVQAGHNYRTVTLDGRPLTVDLWPFGHGGAYVHSVSCGYHTGGPQSVDSAMIIVIQRCLFASVEESVLFGAMRADLTDYARTGKGGPRRIGYETVTVTEDALTYDVVASAD